MSPKIYPLSETTLTIDWGNIIDEALNSKVIALHRYLGQHPFPGLIESVPCYASITVYYKPGIKNFETVKNHLLNLLSVIPAIKTDEDRVIKIPVCYDDEFGHDLEFVAGSHNISKEHLIKIHHQKEYKVFMMGFLPGFAYMGSVDDSIATARKLTPAPAVDAGSVGIAGKQTGIYPFQSPGGWQIIGRTPIQLFDIKKDDPFFLKTGDTIKFYPIDRLVYESMLLQKTIALSESAENKIEDVTIVKPGLFSSIQDHGRYGYQSYGVPISGAMDQHAYQIANALVGNKKNAVCIECTMGGLQVQFKKNSVIAITGAGIATINGRAIKTWQPLKAFKNDLLEIRYNADGLRSYLAVRGGFETDFMMNSYSVHVKSGIGRSLKTGDALKTGETFLPITKPIADAISIPVHESNSKVRVIEGPEFDWMDDTSKGKFYDQQFCLSNQSDRMGYQIQGEPLSRSNTTELVSTAVTKGTVQLTPSGQLIILMSDCQTTGGYPRVGQIAAIDLPLLAQLKPGDMIRFNKISFEEAETLYLLEQKEIDEFFDRPQL